VPSIALLLCIIGILSFCVVLPQCVDPKRKESQVNLIRCLLHAVSMVEMDLLVIPHHRLFFLDDLHLKTCLVECFSISKKANI
jgi:hypothetical protein